MQVRGTRPGFNVYVRTSSAAVLSIIKRILNLELLNGIRSGNRDSRSTERSDLGDVGCITVRIYAVEHEVVVAASRPIGADLLASGPQLGGVHDIRVCSGRQAEDLGKVAIHERQVDDGFLIDDSSQSGILRLNKRRLRTNRDLFLCSADRKLNLKPAHLGDLNVNAFQDERLKSGHPNRELIVARSQEWDR